MVYQWVHSRQCPAYVRSEQTSLNSTGVTPQTSARCILRTVAQLPTARRTSPPVDHRQQNHGAEWTLVAAVGWETRTSDVRAMPLKHKIMMRQQYIYTYKKKKKALYSARSTSSTKTDWWNSDTVFLTSGRLLERLAVTTGS